MAQLQPTISVGLVLEAAGYKPEVAKALADYSDQDGQSAGPAIAATAQQFGAMPELLMEHLNRMDPDKVHDLVEQAWTVNADDKGQFPLTAPNDRNVWAPPGKDPQYGGSYPTIHRTSNSAASTCRAAVDFRLESRIPTPTA